MKKLYVSDLDGTLLDSNSKLSSKSLEIINTLIQNGLHFTFATARSIHSASIVCEGLTLQTPMIVYNGAFILDTKTHTILYSQFFTKELSAMILKTLVEYQHYPFVYAFINGEEKVSYLGEYLHEGGIHYLNSRKNDKRFRCVDTYDELFEGDIFYFTCIHNQEHLKPVYENFKNHEHIRTVYQRELYRDEYWLELMPIKASKANAIQALKEIEQFDYIVSFGDAINDVPMFLMSDECYAVENAIDEVKACATGVIGHHDKDAVALWLKENC